MATVREGRTALLVVDAQAGVLQSAWDAARVIGNIRIAVARLRDGGVPVIWVQHSDNELVHGSDDWQIVPELAPAWDETRIQKRHNSAFEETALEATLASLGVSHIVLAGAATNWCVRATAYGALDRGYDLTLISDGHTTETIKLEDDTKIEVADIVEELNIAMTWLSYPGRTNGTAPARAVSSAAPPA